MVSLFVCLFVCLFQIFIDIYILVQQSESLQVVEDNHCSIDFTIEKKHELVENMNSNGEIITPRDYDTSQKDIYPHKRPPKKSISSHPPQKCSLQKPNTYCEPGKPRKVS